MMKQLGLYMLYEMYGLKMIWLFWVVLVVVMWNCEQLVFVLKLKLLMLYFVYFMFNCGLWLYGVIDGGSVCQCWQCVSIDYGLLLYVRLVFCWYSVCVLLMNWFVDLRFFGYVLFEILLKQMQLLNLLLKFCWCCQQIVQWLWCVSWLFGR